VSRTLTLFKTVTIDHSDTPPSFKFYPKTSPQGKIADIFLVNLSGLFLSWSTLQALFRKLARLHVHVDSAEREPYRRVDANSFRPSPFYAHDSLGARRKQQANKRTLRYLVQSGNKISNRCLHPCRISRRTYTSIVSVPISR